MQPILIAGIVGIILIILVVVALQLRSQRKDSLEDRLGRYSDPSLSDLAKYEEKNDKPKATLRQVLAQRSEDLIKNQDFAKTIKQRLARADLKLTVTEFLGLHVVSTIVAAAIFWFFLAPQNIIGLLLGAVGGLMFPQIYVSFKQSSRLRKFEEQLPDILGLWVNALRSGYSNMQSLEAIAREAPNPSAQEMRRVVQEVQLGIPQEEAFDHLLARMPSEDLDLMITAINIQREVGGNLAEILEVIGGTIRERIKLKGEIGVLTAQGRVTGYLISGLPIALGIFLWLINRSYMDNLLNSPTCGWPMLGAGLLMIGIGMAVIQKIVTIEL